jgi:hypothetical protein
VRPIVNQKSKSAVADIIFASPSSDRAFAIREFEALRLPFLRNHSAFDISEPMSALGHFIRACLIDVRFTPESGHSPT